MQRGQNLITSVQVDTNPGMCQQLKLVTPLVTPLYSRNSNLVPGAKLLFIGFYSITFTTDQRMSKVNCTHVCSHVSLCLALRCRGINGPTGLQPPAYSKSSRLLLNHVLYLPTTLCWDSGCCSSPASGFTRRDHAAMSLLLARIRAFLAPMGVLSIAYRCTH